MSKCTIGICNSRTCQSETCEMVNATSGVHMATGLTLDESRELFVYMNKCGMTKAGVARAGFRALLGLDEGVE